MSQVYLLEPMSTSGQWSFIGLIAMLVGIAAWVFLSACRNLQKWPTWQ